MLLNGLSSLSIVVISIEEGTVGGGGSVLWINLKGKRIEVSPLVIISF